MVSIRSIISTKNARDSVVSEFSADKIIPGYGLYPYQRQVLRDIFCVLSLPEKRVVAYLPTGAGKTRVAAHAACRLLNEDDIGGSLVIWLASTEELCEQAAGSLAEAWQFLGLRDIDVHRHWGTRTLDLRRLPSGFLVTGLAKLRAAATQDVTLLAHLASCASGIIFDEAHRSTPGGCLNVFICD